MELSDLRFRHWDTPQGVSPSALFTEPLRSGVYILGFENSEEYVGQTVNFPSRFATHRRHWPDIRTVRFAPVTMDDLDATERALIQQRVDAGVALRNRTLLAQPTGESALDLLVDREVQAAWLAVDPDDEFTPDEHRLQLAQRRLASRQRLDELKGHPLFDQVRASIAAYVLQVIPWPEETEGRQWTLTALPSTARRSDNRRLATLSIQNVEMVFLGEVRGDAGEWVGYTRVNTALLSSTPTELRGLSEVHDGYRSAGRVQSFDLDGCGAVGDLLTDFPQVRQAARRLALGQLRKGRAMFSRAHNDTFADEIFAEIARWCAPVS